jgi:hypothetical protein
MKYVIAFIVFLISILMYNAAQAEEKPKPHPYCTEYKINEHGVERCVVWVISSEEKPNKFHRLSEWLSKKK